MTKAQELGDYPEKMNFVSMQCNEICGLVIVHCSGLSHVSNS